MKKLLPLLLLGAAAPAMAVTSGTVSAQSTIVYACDMTLPGVITMTQSATGTAQGSGSLPYSQNGGTTYTLSALTFTHPMAAGTTTATLNFIDKDGASVVSNSSESSTATGAIAGIEAGTGSLEASLGDAVLAAGTYSVSATLSCSETP